MPVVKTCELCGKEYHVRPSYAKTSKYCSKECSNLAKRNGHNIQCEECGKIFYRRQYHINRGDEHHFCSNECSIKYRSKMSKEDRICPICGKSFNVTKCDPQIYCSVECTNIHFSMLVGENNSNFTSVKKKCDWCGQEKYFKLSKLEKQEHFFCSDECRREWYAKIGSQTEQVKMRSRKNALKCLAEGKFSKINSRPQQIVDKILNEINVSYEREYITDFYSIDNYLKETGLMIEVMGDYWHCNPLKYQDKIYENQSNVIRKDHAKHTFIHNKYNVEILYLWENDIINNAVLCKNLILKYIESNGVLDNYHSFNYMLKNNKLEMLSNLIIPYQDKERETFKDKIIDKTA